MAKKAPNTIDIDDFREIGLPAFKRTQRFENSKNYIQIFLMWIFALAVLVFLVLLIVAGTTQYKLPDTEGVRALAQLFVEITSNAKAVVLFALGFFFREYLNAKNLIENKN